MADDEESREARAERLRPLVTAAVRAKGSSLRTVAAEIGMSHATLAAFLKPHRSSTPYDRTLAQIEEWTERRAAGTGAQLTAAGSAGELATLVMETGVLVQLLERLPAGQLLEALYTVASEAKWEAEAIARLDAVAPALLRGATTASVTGESRAELYRDQIQIERLVDRVAQRLAVIPPDRLPADQRRRPRAAQAHRGEA